MRWWWSTTADTTRLVGNGKNDSEMPKYTEPCTPLPPQELVAALLHRLRERDGARFLLAACAEVCTADELKLLHQLCLEHQPSSIEDTPYFEVPIRHSVSMRFPWLFSLMLVQSVSGFVVESFDALIQQHLILAAFLTMLVGGGGNSSGQTIAELVKRLGRKELNAWQTCRILRREVTIGALLSIGLAIGTFLRVKLLSRAATNLDAIAITVSYMLIVTMANAVGVITVMVLSSCGVERVGAPPVVQVLVDILGITLTCMVSLAILGTEPIEDSAARI